MSDENTSQTNTEDVQETNDQPMIGESSEEVEAKGPQPIYEETSEDKESAVEAEEKSEESEDDNEVEETEEKQEDTEKVNEDSDKVEAKKAETDYDSLDKPDGSKLSNEDIERILETSKQEGLSKDDAQKRVDEADSVLKSFSERTQQTHREMVEQWAKDTKDDKEVGGENYVKSVELAKRAAHKFGSKEFLQSLNETGFGNHPEVIRTFSRIGKMMSDDSLVTDGSQTLHHTKPLADVFYGKDNNN